MKKHKKREKVENVPFADKKNVMVAKYDHEDGTEKSSQEKVVIKCYPI